MLQRPRIAAAKLDTSFSSENQASIDQTRIEDTKRVCEEILQAVIREVEESKRKISDELNREFDQKIDAMLREAEQDVQAELSRIEELTDDTLKKMEYERQIRRINHLRGTFEDLQTQLRNASRV